MNIRLKIITGILLFFVHDKLGFFGVWNQSTVDNVGKVACDIRHMTCDMWHVTQDSLHMIFF